MTFNFLNPPIGTAFFDSSGMVSTVWIDYFIRTVGVEQFNDLELTVSTLLDTVDGMDEDLTGALDILDGWASDGILSSIEKKSFNTGFIERCIEFVTLKTKATAFSIDTSTFVAAFELWGTYLNDDDAWTAPTDTIITDDEIPVWVNQANLDIDTVIDRETFIANASNYFVALDIMREAVAQYIVDNVDNVVTILAGWAVDEKFSPTEKAAFNIGWVERCTEYLEVVAAAADLYISTTTFAAAFDVWGTYINGGVAWDAPTSTPILDVDMPSWIQEANLNTATDIDRGDFVGYARTYLDALITIKIAIAENVNDNIDYASSILADWSDDGNFSYFEKLAFKSGWDVRSAEYLDLYTQATDLGLTTAVGTFKTAFETWGTYLNGGSAWTALTELPVTDDKTPLWIKAANVSTSTVITRADFVGNGNTYFAALTVLKGLIAENVNTNISGALDTLDDWASDTVFAPIEKKAFYDGWKIRSIEYLDIKARATALSISTDDFVSYFDTWGTYLNDGDSWDPPTAAGDIIDANMPSWFNSESARSTATVVVRADFVNAAQGYLTELYTIKGLIAGQVNTNTENAQTTADAKIKTFYQDSIPTSTAIGDIWFDTDDGNKQYRAASAEADEIAVGEWELAQDANVSKALNIINGWAVDGWFSPIEKSAFNAGWVTRSEEFITVRNQATSLSISTTAFVAAFDAWGTYLNNGDAWTPPTAVADIVDAKIPSWIKQANLTTSTAITRSTFVSTATTYFTALATIRASIVTTLNSNTSTAATTAAWTGVSSRPTTLSALNSTDGTKLSGIEAGAQVTSTSRVNAALTDQTLAFTASTGKIQFGPSTNYLVGTSSTVRIHAGAYCDAFFNAEGGILLQDTNAGHDITISAANTYLNHGTTSGDKVQIKNGTTETMYFKSTGLFPNGTDTLYIGYTANYWKEIYATTYQDNGGGYHDTMDDLAIIAEFKPRKDANGNSIINPLTGGEYLDLHSLPDWMIDKNSVKEKLKKDNGDLLSDDDIEEMVLDYDEAGYMISRNKSAYDDLTNGAVRQLDVEMKEVFELLMGRITALENEIKELKK